jgi:ATP-binding cassette subfamily B protein
LSSSTIAASGAPSSSGAPKLSAAQVLRRGIAVSPELVRGVWVTLTLSLLATGGRVVVPVAVQQTIDRGIVGSDGPRPGLVAALVGAAMVGVVITATASYISNVRLFRATEAGLKTLRVKAFRHIHDLSMLTQNSERRGSLVARVTSDVDTISTFVQWGGLLLVLSVGQLLVATVLMAIYSWQLTLLVWVCFLPLFIAVRPLQRKVATAYGGVRERVGDMLGAISEAVVGADTIRAYAVEERTQQRIDGAIDRHRSSAVRAQLLVAASFSGGVLMSGLVVAAVVVVGVKIGVAGDMTLGRLLAVLFLVQLFTTPVQMGTEVLNELQNAAAGWRRVLSVLDTRADVADPGADGVDLPRGPIGVRFEGVSFSYPDGPPVLRGVDLVIPERTRVAIVGETGSGKTTLAKLLTRLMDPAAGQVLLDGVDLRRIRFENLRSRVVMVPQEGFLFDLSLADNIAWGRSGATREDVTAALAELRLLDWAMSLPRGLDTPVGQRGESLSAGERQLVALARAYLADPDLLVLDEATSAVDNETEAAIQRSLAAVTARRTALVVAHRLSTVRDADRIWVLAAGRVAESGRHDELVALGGIYAGLWAVQTGEGQVGAAPPGTGGVARVGR